MTVDTLYIYVSVNEVTNNNMRDFVWEEHLIVSCHFQLIGTQRNMCHLGCRKYKKDFTS